MLQAFMMVLREGFESFLIVAIILSYLRKSGRHALVPVVYVAIGASLVVSAALGLLLMRGINQALWEGVLGLVTIAMVGTLFIHMWRTSHKLREDIHRNLENMASRGSMKGAVLVFLFTLIMISREGMETVLMLLQVRDQGVIVGIIMGLVGAGGVAWLWARYGHLINVKRFFQVTGVFLLLFMIQVAIYSFHEFSEAGVFPDSEAIHAATEPFSPVGRYGQWFPLVMVLPCALWLFLAHLLTQRDAKAVNQ